MANIHYEVRIKIIKNVHDGKFNFLEETREFENQNPIIARNDAFKFYAQFIAILHEDERTKLSNKDEEPLKIFLEGDDVYMNNFGNEIGIYAIINKSLNEDVDDGDSLFIHGIKYRGTNFEAIMNNLDWEYQQYILNSYNTNKLEVEISFYDRDEWAEGYLGNGKWEESYFEPSTHTILKTPIDWEGMDEEYWWDHAKKSENNKPTSETDQFTPADLIKLGEGKQIEFKPSLLYNFKTKQGGIGVKQIIAKTIASFLNTQGGFLLIGVQDNGNVTGLSNDFSLCEDKNENDFFRLEFDDMISQFLGNKVVNNISGDFHTIDEKEVFIVTVRPLQSFPAFLKEREGKKFFVRGNASSRQIEEVDDIVNYCIERFNNKSK
ncbi:AlbA family DNA-binding domain-containing protein [Kaistella antarctica]|uniref:Divergent AAA domain n=1 Tax=Kaistella antarctica TaxID=266748 RepID=A0A3S4WUP2_9FLAO|nr:ATP-binding protein [Kaistella antarctica]KEY20345.1 hypothetical protein HY04_03850 [Kaistella antarctica]SEV90751.1 Putative DNA-binding domain-containing protein [Kaistella antarctica]VEI01524.1 Divergent AAA domain [Kaistella antarctica]